MFPSLGRQIQALLTTSKKKLREFEKKAYKNVPTQTWTIKSVSLKPLLMEFGRKW
jgi:hypothetical protein